MRALLLGWLSLVCPAYAFAAPILAGFDASSLPRRDDVVSGPVALGFIANFYGASYPTIYVSNNGFVSFDAPRLDFSPTGLGLDYAGQPVIAPFMADVDTRAAGSGFVQYGTGVYSGHVAFGVTWPGVGYFQLAADRLNTFQLVLVERADRGAGDFDILFNYGSIQWESGYANGGIDGRGGTTASAGWNAGTRFYATAGSLVPGALLDGGAQALVTGTNDGVPGQMLFAVQNGAVDVPEPGSAVLLGMAVLGYCSAHWKARVGRGVPGVPRSQEPMVYRRRSKRDADELGDKRVIA